MILSLNLYNTHASFLLTPLSTKSTAVTLLTNSILPLRNHIHRDNIFRTKSKEQQSILPLLCCLSQKGIEIRTRTTLLQAHTHRWLASFGGAGNGNYRGELLRGLEVIVAYQTARGLQPGQALVRAFRALWQWSHRGGFDCRSRWVGDTREGLRLAGSASGEGAPRLARR